MGTEIKVWEIVDDQVKPVEESCLGSEHLESELENWIIERPDLLGDDLFVISKQKSVQGVGRLDLIAIQPEGQLVIVELKRDKAPRATVAQALDYAAWLDKVSTDELFQIAEDYLHRPLSEAFVDRFGKEMPAISPKNHRILLVSSTLDASAERIINYLAISCFVDINAIFFRYAKLSTGQKILARSVLVAESVLPSVSSTQRKPSVTQLLALASTRNVFAMVEAFRDIGKNDEYASEEAAATFGGSFRYWRKNLGGRSKMILGVNVSGQRKNSPAGELDIWIPVPSLAEVLGVAETQAKQMVADVGVLELQGSDAILRFKASNVAQTAAKQVKKWFEDFPGFYGTPNSR